MSVHVEIGGKPWCCYYDRDLFSRLVQELPKGQPMPICGYSLREEAQKESVEVLARFGVTATVVDGPCPEYGKSYEEE